MGARGMRCGVKHVGDSMRHVCHEHEIQYGMRRLRAWEPCAKALLELTRVAMRVTLTTHVTLAV